MCCKLCKKFFCMVIMAVMIGGVLYFLCSLKNSCEEKDATLVQEKRERLKNACRSMCSDTRDIADEVKSAARCSAAEMKDGLRNAGEAVKTAAENIRDDVKDMKDSAGSVFESGENA